ncbi:DUF1232 domain-containing protein [Romboutsia maritimum]|uniref:DUF1232 domain-containing protein n=1 Tax=Romboutsia maritimum TaxID=2020948 RepID=A0A371IWX6_9FIRM|nr:YkvA family protein [Romboutsia maritimum]RDY24981.1 DUF1232 domain-containing protein [Romboutsia maritimum]
MKNLMRVIDSALNLFKKILVRFRNSKFGLLFIVNIFKIPDFINDKNVNIISKLKVIFSMIVGILYLVLGIDFIPEFIFGGFGLIDDSLVLIWSLGIVNEEIEKYKKNLKEHKNSNIIEDIEFTIKDEKE